MLDCGQRVIWHKVSEDVWPIYNIYFIHDTAIYDMILRNRWLPSGHHTQDSTCTVSSVYKRHTRCQADVVHHAPSRQVYARRCTGAEAIELINESPTRPTTHKWPKASWIDTQNTPQPMKYITTHEIYHNIWLILQHTPIATYKIHYNTCKVTIYKIHHDPCKVTIYKIHYDPCKVTIYKIPSDTCQS